MLDRDFRGQRRRARRGGDPARRGRAQARGFAATAPADPLEREGRQSFTVAAAHRSAGTKSAPARVHPARPRMLEPSRQAGRWRRLEEAFRINDLTRACAAAASSPFA